MHDFNQRATQHEKDHPKFPGVKSCWDVPQVQELIAKYEVDHSVINIVEDRAKQDGDFPDDSTLEFFKLLNKQK